jgi:hypothetical protein
MKNWDIDQYITGLLSYATMIKYNDTPYKVWKNSSPTVVAHLHSGVLFLSYILLELHFSACFPTFEGWAGFLVLLAVLHH